MSISHMAMGNPRGLAMEQEKAGKIMNWMGDFQASHVTDYRIVYELLGW
jgi:hypothetical protein